MSREREKINPPTPKSFKEFAQILQDSKWEKFLKYDHVQFTATNVKASDSSNLIVLEVLFCCFAVRSFIFNVIKDTDDNADFSLDAIIMSSFSNCIYLVLFQAICPKNLSLQQGCYCCNHRKILLPKQDLPAIAVRLT